MVRACCRFPARFSLKVLATIASLHLFSHLFSLIVPATVSADPPSNDRRSRENPAFEAQGSESLQSIMDWIARNHIFSNGIVTAGYNVILRPQDLTGNPSGLPNPESHNLTLHIETRLYAHCITGGPSSAPLRDINSDGTCNRPGVRLDENYAGVVPPVPDATVGQVLPFEISMSLQENDPQSVSVQMLRMGAYRVIAQSVGVTAQFGTYTFENYRHQLGVRHGFSIASVTINEVLRLDHHGRYAIVFRGFIDGDIGTTIGHLPALDAARSRVGWGNGNGAISLFGFRSQGSVGIRFFDRILFEFMAGFYGQFPTSGPHYGGGEANFYNTDGSRTLVRTEGGDRMVHTYLGGGVRFRLTHGVSVTASLIRNTYDMGATYSGSSTTYPAAFYGPGYDPRRGDNPNTVTNPELRPTTRNTSVDASSLGTTTVQDLSGFVGVEFRY